jgi:hypothetical protein
MKKDDSFEKIGKLFALFVNFVAIYVLNNRENKGFSLYRFE